MQLVVPVALLDLVLPTPSSTPSGGVWLCAFRPVADARFDGSGVGLLGTKFADVLFHAGHHFVWHAASLCLRQLRVFCFVFNVMGVSCCCGHQRFHSVCGCHWPLVVRSFTSYWSRPRTTTRDRCDTTRSNQLHKDQLSSDPLVSGSSLLLVWCCAFHCGVLHCTVVLT